jgi:hypothetical protein
VEFVLPQPLQGAHLHCTERSAVQVSRRTPRGTKEMQKIPLAGQKFPLPKLCFAKHPFGDREAFRSARAASCKEAKEGSGVGLITCLNGGWRYT